jgi:hypothetical protein
MILGSSLLNRNWIHRHQDDARAVNLAARQRMLAQRILLSDELLRKARASGDPVEMELRAALRQRALEELTWEHLHLFHPREGPSTAKPLPADILPQPAMGEADIEVHAFLRFEPSA